MPLADLSSSSLEWWGRGNEFDTSKVPSRSRPSRSPWADEPGASFACLMIFDTACKRERTRDQTQITSVSAPFRVRPWLRPQKMLGGGEGTDRSARACGNVHGDLCGICPRTWTPAGGILLVPRPPGPEGNDRPDEKRYVLLTIASSCTLVIGISASMSITFAIDAGMAS